jgi:hypothetical protein
MHDGGSHVAAPQIVNTGTGVMKRATAGGAGLGRNPGEARSARLPGGLSSS